MAPAPIWQAIEISIHSLASPMARSLLKGSRESSARSPWSAQRQKYFPACRSRTRRRGPPVPSRARRITASPRWSTAILPPARPATGSRTRPLRRPAARMIRRRPPTQGRAAPIAPPTTQRSAPLTTARPRPVSAATILTTMSPRRARLNRSRRRSPTKRNRRKNRHRATMLPRAIRPRPIRTARLLQQRMRLQPRFLL